MKKEYDFSGAKRAKDIPSLVKLQSAASGKTRITIRVDDAVLQAYKKRAGGRGYQTLINEALSQYAQGLELADVVRNTIREMIKNEH